MLSIIFSFIAGYYFGKQRSVTHRITTSIEKIELALLNAGAQYVSFTPDVNNEEWRGTVDFGSHELCVIGETLEDTIKQIWNYLK